MANSNSYFNLGGNGAATIAPDFDTKAAKFIKLSDCVGKKYRLFGYMITKPGKYGRGVAFCATEIGGDGSLKMIDLPKRYVDIFEKYNDEQKGLLTSGRYQLANVRELPERDGKKATFIFDIEEID